MSAAAESSYRMAELVRRSGVTRETIHYYLREGLLPRPEKTARNTALYNEEHVRRLSLIRSLREQHLLPLKAIKGLLADQSRLSFTPDQLAALQRLRRQKLDASLDRTPERNRQATLALARELDLSPTELHELREQNLLSADDDEAPDNDEAETLRLWALVRNAGINATRGFSPRDMAYVNRAAEVLFDREVALFQERLHNLSPSEIDALLHTVIPAVNRLVALRHERMIAALLEAYAAATGNSPTHTTGSHHGTKKS